ncbi:hypothetical protein Patl1_15585 [Pistacia atlantica]|uniref:Uncharacterized protein n=1 Tax=Pistacia atlantica TaxID=434234 RepID=A0ACC1B9W0_9ROSI|nr:hypothetical protein Patl1_15585 [Pistacia atlantica]
MSAPFTDLLSKDNFHWTDHAMAASTALKEAMVDTPILALPNFSIPFVLENDALGVGIGVVLMQNHHPITFYSRKLSKTMQGKSTYIREMFAITSAMAKWCQYLLGC